MKKIFFILVFNCAVLFGQSASFDNNIEINAEVDSTSFKIGEKIDNPIDMYLSDIYTVPMSLAGMPAMNIPFGFSSKKLPIGLQLTANQFEENKIFSLARFINDNV